MKLLIAILFLLAIAIPVTYKLFNRQINHAFSRPLCPDCNVILISLDTLGSNHLPCYGYNRNTAPNLCEFAKDNIQFTESFSNSSWTLPSHFSIFTSLYPKHHGMETKSDVLNEKALTLTQILKANGYKTVYTGPIGDPYLPLDKGLGRGFDKKIRVNIGTENWDEGYRELLNNAKSNNKTFLFLHTYWVHNPYLVDDLGNPEGKRIFTQKPNPGVITNNEEFLKFDKEFFDYLLNNQGDQKIQDLFKGVKNLSQAENLFNSLPNVSKEGYRGGYDLYKSSKNSETVEYAKALYDELILYLDKELADLFKQLSKNGLDKNTVVIITSDHGEEFMEHGSLGHRVDQLYNSTTSTPLIMHIPGVKNIKIDEPVQGVDIMPTILDVTGVDKHWDVYTEGINLSDFISKKANKKIDRYLISQGTFNEAIRRDSTKLYVNHKLGLGKSPLELYHLEQDPSEKNNLADIDKNTVNLLFNKLQQIIYKK